MMVDELVGSIEALGTESPVGGGMSLSVDMIVVSDMLFFLLGIGGWIWRYLFELMGEGEWVT